jgi:hypothetical protein
MYANICVQHPARNVAKYKTLMQVSSQPELVELMEKLNAHLAHRKTRRRDIKTSLAKDVAKIMQVEANEEQKITGLASSKTLSVELEDDAEEDGELDEGMATGRNEEAEAFKSVEEGQILVIADEGEETEDGGVARAAFIREWLNLVCCDIFVERTND